MKITTSNVSNLPPQAKETLDEMLKPTTPNLYLTPQAGSILFSKPLISPLKTYELGSPTSLYAVDLPTAFLHPGVKKGAKVTGILSDFGGKMFETDYPMTAANLQGMSIIVGGYECVERLLKPEKYNRWQLGFALSNLILSVLNFFGKYIPQVKNISGWLLTVKVFVRVGDEIAECIFEPAEKREILKIVQAGDGLSPSK